jgi:hypothetical protein
VVSIEKWGIFTLERLVDRKNYGRTVKCYPVFWAFMTEDFHNFFTSEVLTDLKRKDKITLMKFLPSVAAILVLGVLNGYSQEPLEVGSVSLSGKLLLEGYYHTLGDNWSVRKAGYKGINWNYSYTPSTPTSSSGETVFGETLFLNLALHPTKNLSGSFGFEFINDYADRYWMPINLEHRMKIEGNKFSWNNADVAYTGNSWSLRYFRNIAHYDWSNEGDLFNLYPAQTSPDKYLQISGRTIPEGGALTIDGGRAGNLQLIAGPEVLWDYRWGVYANLSLPFTISTHTLSTGTISYPMGNLMKGCVR